MKHLETPWRALVTPHGPHSAEHQGIRKDLIAQSLLLSQHAILIRSPCLMFAGSKKGAGRPLKSAEKFPSESAFTKSSPTWFPVRKMLTSAPVLPTPHAPVTVSAAVSALAEISGTIQSRSA